MVFLAGEIVGDTGRGGSPSVAANRVRALARGVVSLRAIVLPLVICVVLPGLAGCQGKRWRNIFTQTVEEADIDVVDPERLGADLRRLMVDFQDRYIALMGTIAAQTDDRTIREITLQSRIAAVDAVSAILTEPDARVAFVYAWALVIEGRRSLTEGRARDDYGDRQALVVALIEELEADIEELGKAHFGDEVIASAAPEMEELARRVTGPDRIFDRAIYAEVRARKSAGLGDLLLAPVTSLYGVATTPEAINNIARVVDGLVNQIDLMPQRMRWETEMLLFEVESLETVAQARANLDRVTTSVENMTETVNQLPDRIEKLQPELRATLAQGEKTAAQVREATHNAHQALETANELTPRIHETVLACQRALTDVRLVLGDYRELKDRRDPNLPPLDLQALVDRAHAVVEQTSATAVEIRQVLAELDQSLGPDSGVTQTSLRLRELIDMVVWRVIILLAALGGMIVVVVFLTQVIRRRMAPQR